MRARRQGRTGESVFFQLVLCSVVLSLAACVSPPVVIHADVPRTMASHNEVPVSANFPTSTQLKLQAAQHWSNIADDTGKAIATLLSKGSLCVRGTRTCQAVFINPPAHNTEFSRIFHNQLITTMVTSGLNVSKGPESAVLIDIDVQPVVFAINRPQYRHAGTASELGPGIWALRDVATMSPGNPKNQTADPDALHWFRTEFASGRTPQMEIVVTVSASDKTRYLARTTNVYYVTDGDKRLYDQEICSLMRSCAVAVEEKKSGPAAKPTRPIGVVGDCPLDKPCCPEGKPCGDVTPPAKKGKKA